MKRRGLTLLELIVVLTILVALATLVVPNLSWLGQKSQLVATQESLQRLQDILVNHYIPDMGGSGYINTTGSSDPNPYAGSYLGNTVANLPSPGALGYAARKTYHPQLRYLFVNPDSTGYESMVWTNGATMLSPRRWQGPYIQNTNAIYQVGTDANVPPSPGTISNTFSSTYGLDGDPTVLDAWGRPIVIQVPTSADTTTVNGTATQEPGVNFARLVSAGPDGVINTPESVAMPTATDRGDDVILFLFHADPYAKGPPALAP